MNLKYLKKILMFSQKDLKRFLVEELKRNGYNPVSKNGYLYAPGNYPVLLCAHMDTVHDYLPLNIIQFGDYIESPTGIGGDDRCGIYIILQLIKHFHCSVLFLENEEIGGVGAKEFSTSHYCYGLSKFNNYIVEFDRRGGRDAVFYGCDNYEFEHFITESGYFITDFGSFSDISVIAPASGLAAVNLSSGYYKEHTSSEYINIREVDGIISEVKSLLSKEAGQFEYVEKISKYSYGNRWNYYYDDDEYFKEGQVK